MKRLNPLSSTQWHTQLANERLVLDQYLVPTNAKMARYVYWYQTKPETVRSVHLGDPGHSTELEVVESVANREQQSELWYQSIAESVVW